MDTSTQQTPKTCPCGTTVNSEQAHAEPVYGFWSSLTMLWGVSAAPRAVNFTCLKCGKMFASVKDPALLYSYINK